MMKGTNNNGDDDNEATQTLLQRLSPAEVTLEIKDPVNPMALQQAKAILHELSQGNEGTVDPAQLLKVAQRLGDVTQDRCTVPADLVVSKAACAEAYAQLHVTERTALTNMYTRIKAFAALQRASVVDTDMEIPGGKAGQTVSPCQGTCRVRSFPFRPSCSHEEPTKASERNDEQTVVLMNSIRFDRLHFRRR